MRWPRNRLDAITTLPFVYGIGAMNRSIVVNKLVFQFWEKLNSSFFQNMIIVQSVALLAGKKTPNRTMQDRLVQAKTFESDLQFLNTQKPVFLHFSPQKSFIAFGHFLGLPDLGLGSKVPLAAKLFYIVQGVFQLQLYGNC